MLHVHVHVCSPGPVHPAGVVVAAVVALLDEAPCIPCVDQVDVCPLWGHHRRGHKADGSTTVCVNTHTKPRIVQEQGPAPALCSAARLGRGLQAHIDTRASASSL